MLGLTIRNKEAGFGLSAFREGPTGPDTLMIWMSRTPEQTTGPSRGDATSMGRFEDVLGEACEHFVVHADGNGYFHECRTQDGLTLKEQSRAHLTGFRSNLTATEIRRGGATLPSIISQSDMLNPARWGLPR